MRFLVPLSVYIRGLFLHSGILVPGGMFAGSKGGQELLFHGLVWSSQWDAENTNIL